MLVGLARGSHRWQSYLSAVRAVRLFATRSGVRATDLPSGVTEGLGDQDRSVVARRPLTEQEMADVWAAADDFPEAELAVLVLDLLRETGGRRQSAADLRLDDACWSASAVWLHTKGDENHLRVVSQDLLERIAVRAIDAGWDGVGGAQPNERHRWQPGATARLALRRDDGQPLTRRWFERLNDFLGRRVVLDEGEPFTLHYLRHTTLHQVKTLAGEEVAAEFAGHRRTTTAQYTRPTLTEWKRLHRVMFPKTPPGPVNPVLLAEKAGWLAERGLRG